MEGTDALRLVGRLGQYFPGLLLSADTQKTWAEELAPFDFSTAEQALRALGTDPEARVNKNNALGLLCGKIRAAGGAGAVVRGSGIDNGLVARFMAVVEKELRDAAQGRRDPVTGNAVTYLDLLARASVYWAESAADFDDLGDAEMAYLWRHRAEAASRLLHVPNQADYSERVAP